MRSLMQRSGVLLLALVSIFSANPTSARAQEGDPDAKAYYSYQLTMPKYKKFLAAMVNLANASQRKPEVDQAIEALDDLSIDESVGAFSRIPEAQRGIADAGLTTREFILVVGTYVQAEFAHGMTEHGMSPDSAAQMMETSPANLDFVRKNKAEIARLRKEAEAKSPAFKQLNSEGEDTGAAKPDS